VHLQWTPYSTVFFFLPLCQKALATSRSCPSGVLQVAPPPPVPSFKAGHDPGTRRPQHLPLLAPTIAQSTSRGGGARERQHCSLQDACVSKGGRHSSTESEQVWAGGALVHLGSEPNYFFCGSLPPTNPKMHFDLKHSLEGCF
jgi:hypothetical protein